VAAIPAFAVAQKPPLEWAVGTPPVHLFDVVTTRLSANVLGGSAASKSSRRQIGGRFS
jgi:hypothetical protein